MGFIPQDARWYLADIVLERTIEGDSRNVVHLNTHLIEADSPELAYEKSVALGKISELEYANTDGKRVQVVFRGLRNLTVIHYPLEDGAELVYTERVGLTEEELSRWVTPKDDLGVFAPIELVHDVPNYMPESIMKRLEAEGFDREDLLGRDQ